MKKLTISLLFTTFCFFAHAQFGVRATYNNLQANQWENSINEALNLGQDAINFGTFAYGIDYWFRLKNFRLEFFPTLSYMRSKNHFVGIDLDGIRDINLQTAGFHLNTHLYFLNFKGDCDCPTWSKSEPIFEKGLFLLLSPGVDYVMGEYSSMRLIDSAPRTEQSKATNLSIGLGLGLDIGISDLITVTPYGGIRLHQEMTWEGLLFDYEDAEPNPSGARQLFGGIRLGVRLDE